MSEKIRDRFQALAEELFAEIREPAKPVPGEVIPPVQRLFDTVTVGADGKLTPCRRCGATAYQHVNSIVNKQGGQVVICRGCPLPAPAYDLDVPDGHYACATNEYKCCRCGRRSDVTISLRQVNLYCQGCGWLCLHDSLTKRLEEKPKKKPTEIKLANPDGYITIDDVIVPVFGLRVGSDAVTKDTLFPSDLRTLVRVTFDLDMTIMMRLATGASSPSWVGTVLTLRTAGAVLRCRVRHQQIEWLHSTALRCDLEMMVESEERLTGIITKEW